MNQEEIKSKLEEIRLKKLKITEHSNLMTHMATLMKDDDFKELWDLKKSSISEEPEELNKLICK